MNWGEKIAYLSVLLSLGASIGYGYAGQGWRAIYFGCAAVITIAAMKMGN